MWPRKSGSEMFGQRVEAESDLHLALINCWPPVATATCLRNSRRFNYKTRQADEGSVEPLSRGLAAES